MAYHWHAAIKVPLTRVAYVTACGIVVLCPAHARLLARNGLVNEVEFLGLITQNG